MGQGLAPNHELKPLGQGIGDRDPDPMQTTRKRVSTTTFLVELTARVQACEDQLNNRRLFFWMQAYGDTAAIILNGDTAVGVQRHLDMLAKPGQSLIGCVIENLLDNV